MAVELLGHAKDALSEQGLDCPARAFVSHNDAAWDCCEQLTVHVALQRPKLLGRGDPSLLGRFVVAPVAQFSITIVRAAAVTDPQGYPNVSGDQLQADAVEMLNDLWAIWSWITELWGKGALWTGEAAALGPGGTPMTFDSAAPLGPQGGRMAVRLLFSVDVPAINEALSAS